MARRDRYPSGLTATFPAPVENLRAWGAQLALALDDQPLGYCAPCANPECVGPVDFAPGAARLYCSTRCRNRAIVLRDRALQQLEIIEEALSDEHAGQHGLPRHALRRRRTHLRWWLARLIPGEVTDV